MSNLFLENEPRPNGTPTSPAKPRGRGEAPNGLVTSWRYLRKYWYIALSIAVCVTLGVTFYALKQPKVYQAQATVLFDPNPPRPLGQKVDAIVEMGAGSYWDSHEYYTTQHRIIQSMAVALAVVSELGLEHDGGFIAQTPPGKAAPSVKVAPEDAANALRSRLKVQPIRDSRLATVTIEDTDPARAQRILSSVTNQYIAQNLENSLESASQASEWLRGQLDKLKKDLEESELSLHSFKEEKSILSVAFDDKSNMLRGEITQISEALTAVETKREEVAARRAELANINSSNPTNLPASELLQSLVLQELRKELQEATRERDSLTAEGKGEKHPQVLAAAARVALATSALVQEVRNIQGALDRDLAILNRQAAGLNALFDRAQKQALDLNLLEIEFNRLKRSKENNERMYSLVLERSKESDLSRMLRVNNVRVLERPLLPSAPIRPVVPRNVAMGLLLGLVVGIACAVARGMLDRSVKTPTDVEEELGSTFLGLLPEVDGSTTSRGPKRKRGAIAPTSNHPPELVVHEYPLSGVAEAARALRTNLMFMAPDQPYRTLLVTSGGPSDGKTTVACCIAVAMAQAGQRVVLVDADLRRPRVHRIFRKGSDAGLTTILLENNLEQAVFPSEVPNLSIIPAGPIPPNPAELLQSERFRAVLEQLKGRFDRVIIDSPPVVPVTDAAILSRLVDGTVVVVRAFKTTKDLARHALRALHDVSVNRVGVVLNAVNFTRTEYKYSYYNYYRREGYYAEESTLERGSSLKPDAAVEEPRA